MAAAACLTLAAVHGFIWWNERAARLNLLFAVTATLIAVFGGFELLLMRAQTTTDYAVLHRWAHVPIGLAIIALVGFVRLYFGTGRAWLFWLVVSLRVLVLVLNFLSPASFNFREFTALRPFKFLGETVAVPEGVPTPWARLGEGSVLLALIFVADAAISLWRRGNSPERRRAAFVGGSVLFCIGAAVVNALLVHTGLFPMPYCVSLFFGLITLAMAYELGHDALHAGQLAQDLRESEQRIDLAATAANLGLWSWNLVSEEIWATEKARLMFGLEGSERIDYGRFLQCLHPEDRELAAHAAAKAMNGDGDFEAEYRVVVPGRPVSWISARGRVEFNQQRKPMLMRGVALDITQRKLATNQLRESEARFRTVANSAPVMIWMAGTDKLCTFLNKPWLDFTGRTPEQELGNGWADGVHADDLQRCLKIYQEAFDARQSFEMEYRLRRHDGEYRWITDNGVPRYDAERNFLGYIGSCQDITERKRAEEKFRLAVQASPNAIIMVNQQGKIVLSNALAEKLFGYAAEELAGQSVEVLVPERLRSAHPGHRAGFMAAPQSRPMGAGRELFARRKDGSEVPVEIGLNPIQTSEGILVLCAIVDITERRRAEAEMQTLRHELTHSARVSLMGELSASMAHELNQPLTAILSNAQAAQRFLAADQPDLAEYRDILKDIVQDTTRARDVIRQLRALVKKSERESIRLDLHETIKQVVSFLHGDIVGRNMTVELELGSTSPVVTGDKTQLQQVLINLLLNACDAMNQNTFPNRRVSVLTSLESPEVIRVTVRDSGVGIPVEKMDAIFQPFFTTKAHGLGMGLSLSRSIVESHGGRLWALNNATGGASFCFSLPVTTQT